MRTVVVGGGPVGLYCAMVLARRGDAVTVVERDPGPAVDGSWRRRGVMQFAHPHGFRYIVRLSLLESLPDVWDSMLAAGGVPSVVPGGPEHLTGLMCRRSTFERVLRASAAAEPGVQVHVGLAEALVIDGGRVTGVRVDGSVLEADRVLCATGRGSKLGDELRAPGVESYCGFSYVPRMYRALPAADNWPTWPVSGQAYDGYQALMFQQDDKTLSALIVMPSRDTELARLRRPEAFDAAASLIPQLAPWTDPDSYEPITDPMTGGRLTNGYRGQLNESGQVPAAGLYFVGDTVCTTNPSAGRGISLGLQQAQALLGLLDAADARDASEGFDAWCMENIHPWYVDHVLSDDEGLRLFAGEQLDPDGPLSSSILCAAALEDPALLPMAQQFFLAMPLPSTLQPLEENARTKLRQGWRPAYAEGPTRDELLERVAALVP